MCGYKTAGRVVCGTVVIWYVSLLQVYTVRGDYDTAIKQLQKAAALDPEEKVGTEGGREGGKWREVEGEGSRGREGVEGGREWREGEKWRGREGGKWREGEGEGRAE